MKKNIIVATLVAVAAMTTASAFAADGTIQFTGSVIDASCTVNSLTSGSMEVKMGSIAKAALKGAGTEASGQKFTLAVSNCPTTQDGGIRVLFDGANVGTDNTILALTGAGQNGVAEGVGIKLYDASQTALALNTQSTTYPLNNGAATLDFVARYVATADTVVAGTANATANFSIVYN